MTDILLRIEMETTPGKLYQALSTEEGLTGWWTKTRTSGKLNERASFYFGDGGEHQVDMQITELVEDQQVSWKCVSEPWQGTGEFSFTIQPHERGSVLLFAHRDWPEPSEFYMHCNAKWGFFLVTSLKQYLETGTGQPHPADPSI